MASRHKQIDYLLGRRFPAYLESIREVLKEEIRNHKGASDTSDVVVDAVRRRVDLDPNDLWPDEARRLAAEEALKAEFGSKTAEQQEREGWRRFIDEARGYEADLLDASDDDLSSQYKAAKAEEHAEVEAEAAEKERWAFFSEPHAMADFDYWLELPTWTVDEAVALSFGKEPRVVTRDALRPELGIRKSPFARSFEHRWEVLKRTSEAGAFISNEKIKPQEFIAWATRKGVSLPEQLQPIPITQDDEVVDDDVADVPGELETKLRSSSDSEKVAVLVNEVKRLKRRLNSERSARTNEKKKTFEILFYALYAGFRFNPLSPDRKLVSEILADVSRDLGLKVDADTFRKRLSEMVESLPPEVTGAFLQKDKQ